MQSLLSNFALFCSQFLNYVLILYKAKLFTKILLRVNHAVSEVLSFSKKKLIKKSMEQSKNKE